MNSCLLVQRWLDTFGDRSRSQEGRRSSDQAAGSSGAGLLRALRSLPLAHLPRPLPLSGTVNTSVGHTPSQETTKTHYIQNRHDQCYWVASLCQNLGLEEEMNPRSSQKSAESSRGHRHANQIITPCSYKNQEGITCQVIGGPAMSRGQGATGRRCTI